MISNIMNFVTQDECNPAIETCELNQGEFGALYPKTDMYIFEAVSLVNAAFPVIYYLASGDFEDTQRNRRDRVEEPVVSQTTTRRNRRDRGD